MSKKRILAEQPSDWVESEWRKNSHQIYKLCCRQSRDSESAKDLFQEVALRFCRSAEALDRSRSIMPWIISVIRNTNADMHRRVLKVTPFSSLSDNFGLYCAGTHIEREVVENYRESIIRKKLDCLMSTLSPAEKQAIEFSSIGGIPAREACLYCGIDVRAYSKRKTLAIRKMRKNKDLYLSSLRNGRAFRLDLEDLLTHSVEIS